LPRRSPLALRVPQAATTPTSARKGTQMIYESEEMEEWRDRAVAAEAQLKELKAALASLFRMFPLTQEGIDRMRLAMSQSVPPTQGIRCLSCGCMLPWRRAEWTAYCSSHCAKRGEARPTWVAPSQSTPPHDWTDADIEDALADLALIEW
jgi:hypothetical protein